MMPHTTRLLVVAALVAALGACGEQSADEQFRAAKEIAAAGDKQGAVIAYKSVLQKDPQHAEARRRLGELYLDLELGTAAQKELSRAVELGIPRNEVAAPMTRALLQQGKFQEIIDSAVSDAAGVGEGAAGAEVLALRGHALLAKNREDAARQVYHRALDQAPGQPEARLGLVRIELIGGRLTAGKARLEELVADAPEFGAAWSLLGDVHLDIGESEAAIAAFSRAIDAKARPVGELLQRGLLRLERGHADAARKDLNAARRLAGNDPRVAVLDGLIRVRAEQYTEAKAAFHKVLQRVPDHGPSRYSLGVIAFKEQRLEQAEEFMTRFVNQNPGHLKASQLLGITRALLGNLEGAEAVLKTALMTHPEDETLLQLMTRVLLPQDKAEERISYLRKVAAQQQTQAGPQMELGMELLKLGDAQGGIEAFKEAERRDPETADRANRLQVLAHIRAGEFAEAEALIGELQAQSPDAPLPWNLLGMLRLVQDQSTAAEEAFQRALARQPGYFPAANNLAVLNLQRGDRDRAEALYRQVIKHNPKASRAYLNLAELGMRADRPEEAVTWLQSGIEANPEADGLKLALARLELMRDREEEAVKILDTASVGAKGSAGYLLLRGQALIAQGQGAKAVEVLERLTAAQPVSATPWVALAKAYGVAGEQAQVAVTLDRALAADPDHYPALLARGRLALAKGERGLAEDLVVRLTQGWPAEPMVQSLAAELAVAEGDVAAGLAAYERLSNGAPGNRNWMLRRVALLQELGRGDQEVAVLKAWLAEHPQDGEVSLRLADVQARAGEVDAAVKRYEAMLKSAPDSPLILNNLAWHMKESAPDQARAYAEKGVDLAPDSPEVLETLGVVMVLQGDTGKAIPLLERVVEMAPGPASPRYWLARALAAEGKTAAARAMLDELLRRELPFPERSDARRLRQELVGSGVVK